VLESRVVVLEMFVYGESAVVIFQTPQLIQEGDVLFGILSANKQKI
jgi:hypothetical protein